MSPEILTPASTPLAQLERIWRHELPSTLHPSARTGVEAAAAQIKAAAAGDVAVYGVNTGFGKLASLKIAPQDTEKLQENLILSHCCGVGAPMPERVTRLMMALKLLSLGRGASGVRWTIIAQLEAMLERGVCPVVPAQGSVGASGDLAPLAHMTLALMGEGEMWVNGQRQSAAQALAAARIAPLTLEAKEGLALINGTQTSTALALHGLLIFEPVLEAALVIGALTWGGLSLLGVPASGGLAIIAGLLDIIPMVGPVLSGIPAVLLAFTVSPVAALWTLVLFLVIQQLQIMDQPQCLHS